MEPSPVTTGGGYSRIPPEVLAAASADLVAYGSIEMSARACNGLGSESSDCLPAGITRLQVCPFTVVRRPSPARGRRLG